LKIPLGFATRSLDSAWLDRMNSAGGYVRGNVVWACKAANCMKNDAGYDDFLALLVKLELNRTSPCRLECILIHPQAKLPSRTRPGDAGHDLYAVEDGTVPAGGMVLVSTGVQLATSSGVYYTIEGRSSLWMKGVVPCRGIIDAGYTGEVKVALTNVGHKEYNFSAGDRIAQIIIHHTHDCDIVCVEGFSDEYNERGQNGFGSTGK
jgi:dUTP pyrophosphatase